MPYYVYRCIINNNTPNCLWSNITVSKNMYIGYGISSDINQRFPTTLLQCDSLKFKLISVIHIDWQDYYQYPLIFKILIL